ncbi:MAG: hypothetical protein ACXWRE_09465 [Pseudobdellovibrionaceae bacterium]
MRLLYKILFICSFTLLLTSCAYLQILKEQPKARIISISPEGITPLAIKFKSEIEVENPYNFAIQIDQVHFKFISENKKLIEASNKIFKTLEPAGKTIIPLLFQIEYADMGLALNDFILKNEVQTLFEAEIQLSFPGTWSLPSQRSLKIEKEEKIKLRE